MADQKNFDGRLGDYVDVPARIAEFRAKYPDGSLQPADLTQPYRVETIADRTFIVVVAAAYRTPGDERPGIGMAFEQFPGRTPYTKDSELQNAETSAWGRAIVAALAADAKKGIASKEEVQNRLADRDWEAAPTWDPVDQEMLRNGFEAEIAAVETKAELADVSRRIQAKSKAKELSPATWDHLSQAGAAKRAELNGAPTKEVDSALPDNIDPA